MEVLGYMALKKQFKAEFVKQTSELTEAVKYLILISVQNPATISSIVFFILNMVRSENYDTMIPSLTLKIHDQLKDQNMSYYELK